MGSCKRNKNIIRPHSSVTALKHFADENIPCDHIIFTALTGYLNNRIILYAFVWVITRRLEAYKLQKQGNYPKESI